LRASSLEIYGLLRAARDDGGWTVLDPGPVALAPVDDEEDGEEIEDGEALARIFDIDNGLYADRQHPDRCEPGRLAH
jgi:hypothetical protein